MIAKILGAHAVIGVCVFTTCAFAILTKIIGLTHLGALCLTVITALSLFTVWAEMGVVAVIILFTFYLASPIN